MSIQYSQCWEDPEVLLNVLCVSEDDDVISIASGGDNTFAILLHNPRTLTSIDLNPEQIWLTELKMRAIQKLEYHEFVNFLGVRPCRDRGRIYIRLRSYLSEGARSFWDARKRDIAQGIIHCGKFERYFRIFRRYVLPLIHRKSTITDFLDSQSITTQRQYFNTVWNSRRWQWLFLLFFGKFLLSRLGRDSSYFRYVTHENIANELFSRTTFGFTNVALLDNYFVEYILTGLYRDLRTAPNYLREQNFETLKENVGRIKLVCADIAEYLKQVPDNSITKFNLSDILEYRSSSENEFLLQDIVRTSSDTAIMAFWTLFIPQEIPNRLSNIISEDRRNTKPLLCNNRTFFYNGFHHWNISKL